MCFFVIRPLREKGTRLLRFLFVLSRTRNIYRKRKLSSDCKVFERCCLSRSAAFVANAEVRSICKPSAAIGEIGHIGPRVHVPAAVQFRSPNGSAIIPSECPCRRLADGPSLNLLGRKMAANTVLVSPLAYARAKIIQ